MSLDRWLAYSVRRKFLDRDLEAARGAMAGRVLEIGSGRHGRRGRFVPPIDGTEWIFVDLEQARRPHVRADAERLPFANGTFDTVVALEMLEYVKQPAIALKEMRRVLVPNGNLVISVPFLHRADTAHDFWRMTEHGLRRLLAECGFMPLWIKPQGFAFSVMTNILKHAVNVHGPGLRRWLLGRSLQPFGALLLRWDDAAARRLPTLATFTTGYLAWAKREGVN